ncbi:MAG: hypothetical protein QOJ91_29, partial [Sphingomonadales bacterium]|nr:hypothetical protein [Sphingomonadales bacterium]
MTIYNGDNSPNDFVGGAEADTAYGNGGNDVLAGGGGSDTLDGGADNDDLYSADKSPQFNIPWFDNPFTAPLLDTGSEVDTLSGGAGDDRLFAGYGDNVDGGADASHGDLLFISFLGGSAGVVVDFHLASQVVGGGTIQNVENVAWLQGTDYADDIDVGFATNVYPEFGVVYGMGGDDRLVAGANTVRLDGGEGNDVLDGRAGSYLLQTLDGGPGDDILYARSSGTRARGGDGNDTIYATGLTSGGAGDDVIVLQLGYFGAMVSGDEGNDDITGLSDTANYLAGGGGADIVRGGDRNDMLSSGDFGQSSLSGLDIGLEHDVLTAGAGDDVVWIGYGDDVDGGTGTDNLWLILAGAPAGVVLDTSVIVSGQPLVLGGGTIRNFETIEYLQGSSFADTLTIAAQAITILVLAGDGDDVITSGASRIDLYGGAGDDLFYSGSGADLFNGGAGSDTVDYGSATAGIVVTFVSDGNSHAEPGGDVLIYVENVVGTGFADTLTGNELANFLGGAGGDDILTGNAGDDVLDGGAGADTMRGGIGNDIYKVDNSGDLVEENAGAGIDEIRTSLAAYSLVALPNVENLTAASDIAHDLRGNSGANVVTGGGGADLLRLYDGGNDTVLAGTGNDNIFFGAALTAADIVNGGEGTDTLVLQGSYGSLTLTSNITQIENISLLGGGNTNFGDPGTNLYDYVLTTNDANFAAGVQARINGAALLVGEDFTFNGSAETDAKFVVYGGKGQDTLTGGFGADIFIFAEDRFSPGDTVNGGPGGYDGIFFRGNYTIDFN